MAACENSARVGDLADVCLYTSLFRLCAKSVVFPLVHSFFMFGLLVKVEGQQTLSFSRVTSAVLSHISLAWVGFVPPSSLDVGEGHNSSGRIPPSKAQRSRSDTRNLVHLEIRLVSARYSRYRSVSLSSSVIRPPSRNCLGVQRLFRAVSLGEWESCMACACGSLRFVVSRRARASPACAVTPEWWVQRHVGLGKCVRAGTWTGPHVETRVEFPN